MSGIGIERIYCYPTTLSLDMGALCVAEGYDPAYARDDLMVVERSLNPPWEDTVTMAVNAAAPVAAAIDKDEIGLLIVATETGVDNEKSVSTWVHRYLDLSPHCRNFEVKHACYGLTGAMQLAMSWLASPQGKRRKALLIGADHSLIGLGHDYQLVMGAGAVAVLLSNKPRLIEFETDAAGVYAAEVTDVFRPTPKLETGGGAFSLLTYLEALDHAFGHYVAQVPASADVDKFFDWHVYHMPFAGMSMRAHRALLSRSLDLTPAEARAHFDRKCHPSTGFARLMGGTYGGSTFIGLLSLVGSANVAAGDRVGIFAYGSGSCGEFYAARFLGEAREVAREAALGKGLDARRAVTVDEYRNVERARDQSVMAEHFTPPRDLLDDWYRERYEGRRLLVLDRIEDYYRHYRWS